MGYHETIEDGNAMFTRPGLILISLKAKQRRSNTALSCPASVLAKSHEFETRNSARIIEEIMLHNPDVLPICIFNFLGFHHIDYIALGTAKFLPSCFSTHFGIKKRDRQKKTKEHMNTPPKQKRITHQHGLVRSATRTSPATQNLQVGLKIRQAPVESNHSSAE